MKILQKRIIFTLPLLLILLLLSFQTNVVNAQTGEDPANAFRIYLGDTVGIMPGPASDDSIWYIITLAAGHYRFSLTGPVLTDFDMTLFDSDENYIDNAFSSTYPDNITAYNLAAGDYYINVEPFSGTGSFTLNVATYTATQGEHPEVAIPITLGDTVGTIPGPGEYDEFWYVITLAAGAYRFNLTGPGGTDFDLELFNTSFRVADNYLGGAYDPIYPDILKVPGLVADDYYIVVYPNFGSGAFTLNVSTYTPIPGEDPVMAVPITLGETTGSMPGPGELNEFWYTIDLAAGDYAFNLTGPVGTNFDLDLFDRYLTPIDSADDTSYPDILTVLGLGDRTAEDYYIIVYNTTIDVGTFALNITDITQSGGSPAHAIPINLGETSDILLGPAADGSIWYTINLAAGDYEFNLTGLGGTDFNLDLFNSYLNYIDSADDISYPDIITVLGLGYLTAEDYYINVYNTTIDVGTFALNITDITQPGGSPAHAIEITALGDTPGVTPGPAADGTIWYNITLINENYTFTITGGTGTLFEISLYDSGLNYLENVYGGENPGLLKIELLSGDYYINVRPVTGGPFTLNIDIHTPIPGDDPTNPITISLGDTSGTLPGPGLYVPGEFWYIIPLAAGDYQFSLTGPGGPNFDFAIMNSTMGTIGYGTDTVYPDILLMPGLRADDYFIVVLPNSGTGAFTLTITDVTPPPTINIVSPTAQTYTTATITITLSGNADNYWYYITGDPANSTWDASVDRTLTDGTYTLHAYGNDTAGNEAHKIVIFTIDTTPPTTTTTTTTTDTTSEPSDTDGDGVTPGFSFMVILVVMMLGAIIVLRRRRINRML